MSEDKTDTYEKERGGESLQISMAYFLLLK